MQKAWNPIREPAVAGQFYPAEPDALRSAVDDLLDSRKDPSVAGEIVAVVAPHAGYPYSGSTAAAAYRAIRHRPYDAVVVLSPSHQEMFEGASVYAHGGYRTPLGTVPVEEDLARDILGRDPDVHASNAGHRVAPPSPLARLRGEHAIEVQLPFLQEAVPDLRIVPIVIAESDFDLCRRLGQAIARASRGRRVLLVASSDLYHGYSYDECIRTDAETLGRIEAFDPEEFSRRVQRQECQACGSAPITTAMVAARGMGADRAAVVARTNSGDATGMKEGYVVGYGAAIFYRSLPGVREEELTATQREHLLRIARTAIREALHGRPLSPPEDLPGPLRAPRGAFVTLKHRGELRGCIGHVYPHQSVAETVQQMAVAAALRDPRFPSVSPDELPEIEVEISVLSLPRKVEGVEQIHVGEHGLIVHHPAGQGLLLPQVAVERGWDRETFLAHTCRKAGLPKDAWKRPETEISVFSAEVFGER